MSFVTLRDSELCSVVIRAISCLTNEHVINVINPKIDSILPLVSRVESLIKQVDNLSSQLTARHDRLPNDSQNLDMTEYTQQMKRTAEAVIVTASTVIESQSTVVGGRDRQNSSYSNPRELSEELRKRKIEDWISHLTINHEELGPESDGISELMPDDSVSSIGLNTKQTNTRSQQINIVGVPGSSSGTSKSEGTPTNMNTRREDWIKNIAEERFTHLQSFEGPSISSEEHLNSDTTSEKILTEYRADLNVEKLYNEKSEKLLAALGISFEAKKWKVNDALLELAKMEAGQGVRSSSNIVGTVLYLLRKGADVNAIDAEENTAVAPIPKANSKS